MVLMSHGRGLLMEYVPSLQLLKFGGFLGVELFFVLSGFLIGHILLKIISDKELDSIWFLRFWSRRWLRTLPNYFLFLIINLSIINTVRPAAFPNLINYITFTQNLLSPQSLFFGEAWSLSVEEIFYLVTPVFITVLSMFITNKNKLIGATLITIFMFSLLLRVYYSFFLDYSFNDIRTISLLRMDSIMFGLLGAWIYSQEGVVHHYFCKIMPALLIFLPVVIYFSSIKDIALNVTFFKLFFFDIASIVCLAIIISGLNVKFNDGAAFLINKLARWSYSAYLTNLPVLYLLYYIYPFGTKMHCGLILWLAYIFLTFLFSALIYHFYECFFLRLRDKKVPA